jgi:hypothetical protein
MRRIAAGNVVQVQHQSDISECHCGQQPLGDARRRPKSRRKNRRGVKCQNDTGEMGRHGVHIARESGDHVGLDRVESKAKCEDPHRRENHARRREPRPRSIRRRARCGRCRPAEPSYIATPAMFPVPTREASPMQKAWKEEIPLCAPPRD